MNAMRILLTGASGQVGGEFLRRLRAMPNRIEVIAPHRAQLDMADPQAIRQAVQAAKPDLIINPAAYTAVVKAESDSALTRAINAEAPGVLAEEAKKIGAAVLHFSTDYVFDGSHAGAYTEDMPTCPINVYGATKRDGELAIAATGAAHWILRTSWVYNLHGGNFMKTAIRLAQQKEAYTIVGDQFGAPTWASTIAAVCCRMLAGEHGGRERVHATSGTYHLTAAGATSWHGYASLVARELMARGIPVKLKGLEQITPVPTSTYPTPPQRPLNSRLDCGKLERTFGITLPTWDEDALACLQQIIAHYGLDQGKLLPD
ncbi:MULTISPECIES: dTDP-4-dehydrorhamnose reductase [unclassified Herbaspirillum]|uniref:dTDP-4-dehydrorhamnose reductase n=1 Tax=unclassified Herbaspirillum TaxID=2624150 RepID=UPI001150AD26|nr:MULTISPECIES: dTDP-4-dehydrorhamnose reductase [unclassified Herbaspirillum]MBB5390103.1 dTDP-4-dehydrorhamnose reductase [Herbaspirillum sp. SJZ102]TQK09398.1 dTDP-4-dehydrorhamnose reductase [Herbaspirillum sp. SJZ130]TQK13915.1 dTDP-4-dehydrorhamnose reductase [Herbaspirillum sp. SJZ106]